MQTVIHSILNKHRLSSRSCHPLLILIAVLPLLLLAACEGGKEQNQLSEFLSNIPDRSQYRQWTAFGDVAGWYAAYDLERPWSIQQLEGDDQALERSYNMVILPKQTITPNSLNIQMSLREDQRDLFGFNYLSVDQHIEAGPPPEEITLLSFSYDKQEIADALTDLGYQAEAMGDGTLYSLNEDYQANLQSETKTNQIGNLNRILLFDDHMVIARATEVIEDALDASPRSLADDEVYAAAVKALGERTLADNGSLIGVIFIEGNYLADQLSPAALLARFNMSAEDLQQFEQAGDLPEYDLATFATYQQEDTAYLTLVVVFPEDTDAQAASEVLEDRMRNYNSVFRGQTLDDRWSFKDSGSLEVDGLPVAYVVMRSRLKETTGPNGNPQLYIFSWSDLVFQHNLYFLATE